MLYQAATLGLTDLSSINLSIESAARPWMFSGTSFGKGAENMRKHVNVSNDVQSALRLEDFLMNATNFELKFFSSFCFYLEMPGFRFRFERYISSLVGSAKARLTLY